MRYTNGEGILAYRIFPTFLAMTWSILKKTIKMHL